ncbi:MAG: 30S ribosomal protein S17 [Acholeplasmatales bacterium]|jgi:small subunit ribosomal protein S17|nr:30S ribosomal protein S17 [Acholeplasmatales bacterium]
MAHKEFIGIVTSTKMEKTITVSVDHFVINRIYKKRVKVSKKFHVHDEQGLAQEGDLVSIIETRPLSKTKAFRLLEVLKTAGGKE